MDSTKRSAEEAAFGDHILIDLSGESDQPSKINSNKKIKQQQQQQQSQPSTSANSQPLDVSLPHDNELGFYRLSQNAIVPHRSTVDSIGFDLSSAHNMIITKHNRAVVLTDIVIKLPKGCYGRIAPRSGLSLKFGINTGAGVIDPDYTGNIGVVLFNHSDNDFIVKKGDRIAQLICEKALTPPLYEITDTLSVTERGDKGFGSTD